MPGSDFFELEIRKRLESYMMRPSTLLWENIESELRSRKRKYYYFKCSLLLLIFTGIWFSFSKWTGLYIQESKLHESTDIFSKSTSSEQSSIKNIQRTVHSTDSRKSNQYQHADLKLLLVCADENKRNKIVVPSHYSYDSETVNPLPINLQTEHTDTAINTSNLFTENECTPELNKSGIKKRKEIFIYFSTSLSDRIFNKENLASIAINSSSGNNRQINYTPLPGWEIGVGYIKNINSRLQIRSGIQLNYNCYTITAAQGAPELASLSLSNSNRMQRLSNLENRNGFKNQEYANRNFQVSVPVGVMVKLNKGAKRNVVAGLTIQPSYLLHASAYLLSTDYRNYVEAPDMLRRLNIHSAAELLYSQKIGHYRVYAGPQIRYQVLSGHIKEYPFREHVIEYGIKMGITREMP